MNPMTPGNYSPFNGGFNSPQNFTPNYQFPQPSLSKFGPNPAPSPLPAFPKPIQGRIVSSYDDILMGDVPQDNSIALFPLEDYSCIYAKQWSKNGQGFDEIRYVPEPMTQQQEESGVTLAQIMDKMNNIETMLNQLNQRQPKNYHKKNYQNNRNSKSEHNETEEN